MKIVNGPFAQTFAVANDNLAFPSQVTVGNWGWPLHIYRVINNVAIFADPLRDEREDVVILEIIADLVVPVGHGRFLFDDKELAEFVDKDTHAASLAKVRALSA